MMKLVSFRSSNQTGYGILEGESVKVLTSPQFPASLMEFIQAGPETLDKAKNALHSGKLPDLAAADVRLLTPLARPGKIVAIGLNYMDHCREQKITPPKLPVVFTKFTTSIIGPLDAITWDPKLTNQVDYEVELGVVIGTTARRVSKEQALDHVFGYTVINDVSARDLQFSDKQWVRAKSLDTFCPIGPCIVTADEIPDPQALRLTCAVNGQILQDSSTAEMIFDVAELIHYLSHSFTYEPGDLIATGTPDGVGVFRSPQIFLQNGDHVVASVERIGSLENVITIPA
jgi:2-keto-4-pentenoate hydratase/2-oxohepta-3-ene-1,7-dioic acid hydratase in catechol pathway